MAAPWSILVRWLWQRQRLAGPTVHPGAKHEPAATSQRVLRAATALFAEHGYAGTTIRAIATKAKVSIPTVETLFGTKARLLKATIDVAIAGDDEPVAMLDRRWARKATEATDVETLLSIVASVLAPAQGRSAGLVLSVFEGAKSDPELERLAAQMSAQRAAMAAWIVSRLTALGVLDTEVSEDEAVDTLFALMEPALFDRLIHQRGWTHDRYERWVARSLRYLLTSNAGSIPMVNGHREVTDMSGGNGTPAEPHPVQGQVVYLQLPAVDIAPSADFYEAVFGWSVDRDGGRFEAPGIIGEWTS